MLVLRKVLGYCTLSFFLLACLFGCMSKFIGINLGTLFQSLKTPQAIFDFAANWLFELVFFIIIGIMCIVALAKFHAMDDVKQEGQLQKLTLLFAICELACGVLLLSAHFAVFKGLGGLATSTWMRLILPILIIVATIVRKAAFVGKNPMASRIMGACVMLVALLLVVLIGFTGFGSLFAMVQVFFLITFILGIGFNVVSIFKK